MGGQWAPSGSQGQAQEQPIYQYPSSTNTTEQPFGQPLNEPIMWNGVDLVGNLFEKMSEEDQLAKL